MMPNRIIWLTGGSGSGKSTAADILRSMGLRVIDADKVAKKITRKGEEAYCEITDAFGTDILAKDGELDRHRLGAIVFADAKKLGILDSITHKYIKKELLMLTKDGTTVIDAALPPDGFLVPQYIIAVTADKEERIRRIIERDSITREHAKNRISSQISDEEYARMADAVFYNNGTADELKNQIENWCINEKII